MTWGDQQHTKINAAATNIFARRLRDRNVDVCGNGNSDDGIRSSLIFFDDWKFRSRCMDLWKIQNIFHYELYCFSHGNKSVWSWIAVDGMESSSVWTKQLTVWQSFKIYVLKEPVAGLIKFFLVRLANINLFN